MSETSLKGAASKIAAMHLTKGIPTLDDIIDQIIDAGPDKLVAAGRLQYLRRLLKKAGAAQEYIDRAKDPELTTIFNAAQEEKARLRSKTDLAIPAGLAADDVAERLAEYDLGSRPDDKMALVDVMVAGCLRPSEVLGIRFSEDEDGTVMAENYSKSRDAGPRKFLCLTDFDRYQAVLEWVRRGIIEHHIVQPGGRPFNAFVQEKFGILPKGLRAIGSVLIARSAGRSLSAQMAAQRTALRHKEVMAPQEHYGTYADL